MDILDRINNLEQEVLSELEQAGSESELDTIVSSFIGRKGILSDLMSQIGTLPPEKRPEVGKTANQVKNRIQKLIQERKDSLSESGDDGSGAEYIDVTAPLISRSTGSLHPISQVRAEMERIFLSMGFDILDGPHIESEYYNFEALNIPADHPAREHQDTFWLKSGLLLRTHTSNVQVRTYLKSKPPFAAVVPGRVFRYEAVDASHENTFNQIEGFMVDENISIGNLVGVLKTVLSRIFRREVTVRLRPGFFPFVEPGYELDFQCLICSGKGCSVCKRSGWVEFLGCGMIHPNVLAYGNIDSDRYTGFAFGMGLDRLTMMLYRIDNIRIFQGCDLRALRQFSAPTLL